jgi:UPF0755 protein
MTRASRPRRFARGLLLLFLLVLLAAASAFALLRMDWETPFASYPRPGVFVDIPRGMTVAGIAQKLESAGVVRSAWSFRLLEFRHPRARLKAGEYFFDHPESPVQVFDTLAYGRIYLVSVTIPEGFNVFDIAALLDSKEITPRDTFLAAVGDVSVVANLAPGAPSLEGFLFPDTYHFARHQPPRRVVEVMVRRFRAAWQALPENARRASALSPLQLVTLASLVEKETAISDERPLVARVFSNRLQKGIALDCDPTVIYALILEGRYNGRLLLPDLRIDSPYNTYRRRGLPPGPIANPGEASLRAALEPAPGNYFYFVATGDGGHIFSRTLTEHNRNVSRYHQRKAQLAREARSAARKSSP